MAAGADYAVILMDMQMPVMDGLDATRAIRAMHHHRTTPILAMTANVFEDDRRRCAEAGADDFVAKPVEPELLYATLLRWLAVSAAQAPRAPAQDGGERTEANVPQARSAASDAVFIGLLEIPGLDAERGLGLLLGNLDKYLELLRRFVEMNDAAVTQMTLDPGPASRQSLRALAHSLKGSAGTLGAWGLADAAGRLEKSLQGASEPGADASALLAEVGKVRHEFDQLAAALSRLPDLQAPAPDPQALPPVTRQALDELDGLLAQGDVAAIRMFDRHASSMRSILGPAVDELARQVRQYEFEEARATLRQLQTLV
jgi:HPt (histidine-containing phosphotransfer) domain-containing protein